MRRENWLDRLLRGRSPVEMVRIGRRSTFAVLGVAATLAVLILTTVAARPAHAHKRSNSQAIAAAGCFDQKPSEPQGCWVPPAGYVPASKANASFVPISVPSTDKSADTASDIPAGTINDEMVGPFSSSDYLTNNAWWNETAGTDVDVYAGAQGSNPSQGVVVVLSSPVSGDGSAPTLKAFPTTQQDGALTITGAQGWILTLTASDGTVYTFDALTSQFQSG